MKTHLLFAVLLISSLAFGQAKRPGKITKNQTSQSKLTNKPKNQAAGYLKLDGIDGESTNSSKSKKRKITNKPQKQRGAYLKLDGIDGESNDPSSSKRIGQITKPQKQRGAYLKLDDIDGESNDKASTKTKQGKSGNSNQRFYKKRKYNEELLTQRKKRQ